MPQIKITAHYGNLDLLKDTQLPDTYTVESENYVRPLDTFIISKNLDGSVISVYGDNIWNLTPYRLVGHTGTSNINFSRFKKEHISDTKWLIFILLFLANTGRASGLSLTSVLYYMKFIKTLSKFSSIQNNPFFEHFCDQKLIETLINHLHTKTLIQGFRGIALHLSAIGENKTGIKVLTKLISNLVEQKIKKLSPDDQHPVIPPRVYEELLNKLGLFFEEFNEIEDNFFKFLNNVTKDQQFARSPAQQNKLGFCSKENMKPNFSTEAINFGLAHYFEKYKIVNIPSLMTYISRIQHGCRLIIHIYTGMRSGEALNLKIGCLHEKDYGLGLIYIIKGETSKLIGQKKVESWVTSIEACNAIKIAEKIALRIGQKINITSKKNPLFISTSYLFNKSTTNILLHESPIHVTKTSLKNQEFYNLINRDCFKIKEQDIQFLMLIDPFRAWNTEENFQLNSQWRFTTHQFRRSIAYYVSQSSLVSLPSLRRQLKHITHDMALYYCQSKVLLEDGFNTNKISDVLNKNKYKADSCAYLQGVLNSNETLYGASGKYSEKNLKNDPKIYSIKRTELESKFKTGELAYKTTPLGACTTITPCMKKASLEIAACISCDKAIIKKSNLEKVIKIQEAFINGFEDTDCVEFRSEKEELDILINFHSSINKQLES